MTPLVRDRIDRFVENFNGKVYLIQDLGGKAIVLIDPAESGPVDSNADSDWQRVTEPHLMLVDPSRSKVPRLVN